MRELEPTSGRLAFAMQPSIDPVARWIAACRLVRGRWSVRLELRGGPTGGEHGAEFRARDDLDLPRDEQEWLWGQWLRRGELDPFERLGIAPTDDVAAIRRAYLAACWRLHPDRYFGKRVGPFAAVLVDLFDDARAAHDELADPRRRAHYLAVLAAEGGREATA